MPEDRRSPAEQFHHQMGAEMLARAVAPPRPAPRKTLCVDFDGVIHAYTSPWTAAHEIADAPVPGALAFLADASERFDVAIFSARSHQTGGVDAMRAWLLAHGLSFASLARLTFPTEKPPAVVYIDDRAWQFTGTFPSLDDLAAFKPWNR